MTQAAMSARKVADAGIPVRFVRGIPGSIFLYSPFLLFTCILRDKDAPKTEILQLPDDYGK
jgi:hypothetical protein